MTIERSRPAVAELLELALDDPPRAEHRARQLLGTSRDPWWRSAAHHALGIVQRGAGQHGAAVDELRTAARLAERAGDHDRVADVRATLGLTLVTQGRTREGLVQLGRAVSAATDPEVAAKVLMRRGISLSWVLGRHVEGLADLERSLAGFRATGDRAWEARTRNVLGLLHLAVGDVRSAEREVIDSHAVLVELGHDAEATLVLHNQALVAFVRGDLPRALAIYDDVTERYAAHGLDPLPLLKDRANALLAAGLAEEAAQALQAELDRATALPVLRAEVQLSLSQALLAAGRHESAAHHASAARRAFRSAGRSWHVAHAELAELRAREPSGRVRLLTATRVAAELEAERSDEAAAAWLLAGRVAARVAPAEAPALLGRAAAHRTHPVALLRATGWLARALDRDLADDRRGVHLACRRGLDALDAHRASLGSSELRALASGYGADLAQLALARAVAPRSLLWWSERWRATALSEPPVRRTDSDAPDAPLAALRDNARRLLTARNDGADTALLVAERAHLEEAVRRSLRHLAGTGHATTPSVDVRALVDAVGESALVELVEVGDALVAVTVHGGRVRRVALGSTAEAQRAVEAACYALRRTARGRPADLPGAGRRLQEALLGPAADLLRDAPSVVVSPTSRLHGAPWGLLPVLAGVAHSVVPSAALWLRARDRRPTSGRRVFIGGPALSTGGAEIDVVAPLHPGAQVLRHGTATVERSLAALDGCALAHIAAHGHFRRDSPLFSALDLDDGPLTVHDFERMATPPHRVVLSACESGVMAPVGSGELLGLVSALLAVGTAGVVASVEVVNDDATVDLMVDLHAGLDAGDDLASALLRARGAADGDPVRRATAASFLALGV